MSGARLTVPLSFGLHALVADLEALRPHLGRNGPQGQLLGLHGDHLIAEPNKFRNLKARRKARS
jgi:hypothetical protein